MKHKPRTRSIAGYPVQPFRSVVSLSYQFQNVYSNARTAELDFYGYQTLRNLEQLYIKLHDFRQFICYSLLGYDAMLLQMASYLLLLLPPSVQMRKVWINMPRGAARRGVTFQSNVITILYGRENLHFNEFCHDIETFRQFLSLVHSSVCLSTGPQPLPKPVLHSVRSSPSSSISSIFSFP